MKEFVLYSSNYPNFPYARFHFVGFCVMLTAMLFLLFAPDDYLGILLLMLPLTLFTTLLGLSSFHPIIYKLFVEKDQVYRIATTGLDVVLYIKRGKKKPEKVCLYKPVIAHTKLTDGYCIIRINEYEMKCHTKSAIDFGLYLKSAERKRLGSP